MEAQVAAVKWQETPVRQFAVYINVIIGAFFQAVGIQVHIDTVDLLRPG